MADRYPYVIVGPKGIEYLGLHTDEDHCWCCALGWPAPEEIEAAKAKGFRCYRADVTWRKPCQFCKLVGAHKLQCPNRTDGQMVIQATKEPTP